VSKLLWVELSEDINVEDVHTAILDVLKLDGVSAVHEMAQDSEEFEFVGDEVCMNVLSPVLQ